MIIEKLLQYPDSLTDEQRDEFLDAHTTQKEDGDIEFMHGSNFDDYHYLPVDGWIFVFDREYFAVYLMPVYVESIDCARGILEIAKKKWYQGYKCGFPKGQKDERENVAFYANLMRGKITE